MRSAKSQILDLTGVPFAEEELAQLERARAMPITFDEDCPETTPEIGHLFRRVNPPLQNKPRRAAPK